VQRQLSLQVWEHKHAETSNTVTLENLLEGLGALPEAPLAAMQNAKSRGSISPGLSRTQPASPSRYNNFFCHCAVVVLCSARAPYCSAPMLRTMRPYQSLYAICCNLEHTALGAAGQGQPLLAHVLPHCIAVSDSTQYFLHVTLRIALC
jgi:hypothetical protein